MRPRLLLIVFLASIFGLSAAGSAEAAFPGANGKIAYDLGQNIFVINPDGTGDTNLTNIVDDAVDYAPAFSPDGSKIAFIENYEDGPNNLWIMNSDGSGRQFVHGSGLGGVSWSPDGSKLAFTTFDVGGRGIFTINPDGTGLNRLTTSDSDQNPAWSPNGDKIAYRGGGCCVYVMDANGANQTYFAPGDIPRLVA